MKKFILLLLLCTHAKSFNIKKLKIQGNSKTDRSVIITEIQDILLKKKLRLKELKEIRRRLYNLRLFSDIKIKKSKKELIIKVQERWTTIPIAIFNSGGGSEYRAFGLYDINTFGKNIEVGAQYETLNGRAAGVLWTRVPQFFNNRNLAFGVDLWSVNRIRFFFDDFGEDNGAFTLQRKRVNTFLEYKWDNDFFNLGFQYDYHIDSVGELELSDEQKALNQKNSFSPDFDSINRWHTLYFKIGRLNNKNYLIDGTQLLLKSSLVSVSQNTEKLLTAHEVKLNYYKLFRYNQNFAFQFKLNSSNLDSIQYDQFLGGLGEVRGFRDGQFFGHASIQSNLEYRFDLYESSWIVLQGVAFSDQAKEGDSIQGILDSKDEVLLSSGLGIRFISPKIFRFVGRLDYAQTHTRDIDRGISFGIQQFF